MASMEEVHDFLSKIPGLAKSVSMEKAMTFVRLAARLKDEIILAQNSTYDPSSAPSEIPDNVRSFLGCATGMTDEFVAGCWAAFGNTIWDYNEDETSAGRDAQMFREFGFDHLLVREFFEEPHDEFELIVTERDRDSFFIFATLPACLSVIIDQPLLDNLVHVVGEFFAN
ncbi:hypothetical protein B0H13DRAFT_2306962 [Mycena leptocephala]|nr:hypothetical protein B0H13DRAFT_2306962 [Mycena leptocephala]